MIMAWISKLLFFLIFLYLAHRVRSFLARLLTPSQGNQAFAGRARPGQAKPPVSGKMVKDPQCGMYVDVNLAVPARIEGQDLHFCSADCRDGFMNKTGPTENQRTSS